MNKRLWLWGITVLLLLISLPGLYDRFQSVSENDTYELVTPYSEIIELTNSGEITIDQALTTLKEAGLNTVSISPISLMSLQRQGVIEIFSQDELEETLMFSNVDYDFPTDDRHDNLYFTIPQDSHIKSIIIKSLNPHMVTLENKNLFVIPSKNGKAAFMNIAYNNQAIENVEAHNLNYTLRIENADSDDKTLTNELTVQKLSELKDDNFSNLLFSGGTVIGYPNLEQVKDFTNRLTESDFNFYTIEFTNQRGLQLLARTNNYQVIRLHSMNLNKTLEENVNRAVRAVKERNIRSVFFHLPNGVSEAPAEVLKSTVSFVKGVQAEMPEQFEVGIPVPFETISSPLWAKIAVLLSSVLFIYLAASNIFTHKIGLLASILPILLLLLYAVTQKLLLLQVLALMVAIAAPIYAVISNSREGSTRIKQITIHFAKALGISFIGIILVLGILNSTAFVTGFELFRGVKLVYVVPIVFLLAFLFWRESFVILKMQVKYWHLLVISIVMLIGYYYIMRSGNSGTVSELEMVIRQGLEEILYVRPRTKEFLIGFPTFILALYVMKSHKVWGRLLLVPGVIGFLSIVNTFTHFHIPMSISLLRTSYSIVFGFLLGLIFIYIYKVGLRLYGKLRMIRWS